MQKVAHRDGSKAWTTAELKVLRENAYLGAVEVARILGRGVNSVRHMAKRQRLSLRRRGERRGLVLGQPRGVSLRDERAAGTVSTEVRTLRREIDDSAMLCPCCGSRPVEVASTGWCLPCHRRRLTAAHLDELERIDTQRALWASRQALSRARRAES